MELSNIQYFNDQVEDDLKAFFRDGMIGLQNMKSRKKTIPCFEHVITSPKYIFVEVDGGWGLLDKDLCLIIPPKYQDIYPVKEIDREDYISMCMDKSKDTSGVFNADCDCPTHVAIQNANIRHYGRARLLMPDTDDLFDESENLKEENKAKLYEINYEYAQITTTIFVLVSKNSSYLIDLRNDNIQIEDSKEFFFLWHYKETSFIFSNNDSSFGFSSYWEGRFHKETLIRPQNGENDITGSPKIIFYRNDFVSVCLPDINKHVGNTTYLDEKMSISGKWALFRFGHRKRGLNYWKEEVESYFQQLTPFAFTEPLSQIHDDFSFICREMSKEWLVRYDSDKELLESTPHISCEDSEKAAALVDEYLHSTYKPALLKGFVDVCFKGTLKIASSFFDSIEPREDGMYDISTDEGYGLCDENMNVIVPNKYDYPIEISEQLMIGMKNNNTFKAPKRYGIYVRKRTNPIMTSDDLTDNNHYLSGNSSEGFCDLETIIITKDVTSVEWNGLGRYKLCNFEVSPENMVFCEHDGILYTKKGFDRTGRTDRTHMIELVACPANVKEHIVFPGTIRIANCAFKGSNVEKLSLPDTLEEIGVNAFYLANQIKELEIPLSIRKIESQDVGKSGSPSPTIKYDGHVFLNWEDLYAYMCEHGFERKYGNVIKL